MTDKASPSKTSVVCYFCSEPFGNASLLQAHIKQCGSILRQCMRCKAYVERRHFDSHNRLCSKSLSFLDSEVRNENQIHSNHSTSGHNVLYSSTTNQTKVGQNGPANAYLVNSQPFTYTASESSSPTNSSLRQNKDRNVYALPTKTLTSPPRENLIINNDMKYYTPPEYSSLDRSEHSINMQIRDRTFNSRPLSVISSDSDIVQYMRNEILPIRNHLSEEQNQREKLSNEVNRMRKQYLLSEERNQILLATITTLRNNIEDESERHKTTYTLLGRELDVLRNKNDELMQKMSQMDIIVGNLHRDIEREQIDRSHLDLIVNAQDNKLRVLHKLETNIEALKNDAIQEQQIRKDVISHIQKEMGLLKELLSLEISKQKQQLHGIEESQGNMTQKLKTNTDDISKYAILNKESKALMGIVEEDTKKIQSLQETIKNLSNSVATLQKQRFTNHLENNTEVNTPEIFDKTGHLIWKLGDFEQKLKDSIDNESVLLSPIFYSNKYGYALQAELYLNGLGKWRGRHITASVFVIPGQWDALLSWPVKMTAKIILRDQAAKTAQAVPIVKTLQVRKRDHRDDINLLSKNSIQRSNVDDKRKSSENLSTIEKEARALEASIKKQYVFIPHSNLDKFDYIKNNIMFVEIVVDNT